MGFLQGWWVGGLIAASLALVVDQSVHPLQHLWVCVHPARYLYAGDLSPHVDVEEIDGVLLSIASQDFGRASKDIRAFAGPQVTE